MSFDVAVIGGGPAGSIAAYVLARMGRRVIVLNPTRGPARKIGESLPAAARPVLQHLGLLDVVEQGGHLISYGNHSAWGSSDLNNNDFIADPNGLGWHLDRARFDRDLEKAARGAGVVWSHTTLEQSKMDAKFWIDATGRRAVVARKLGAKRQRDDNLMAVYTWLRLDSGDSDTRALVESCAEGWWYTARLPDHTRVLVFHTDQAHVADYLREPRLFDEALSKTVHIRCAVERSTRLTGLQATEAAGARLDRFAGPSWIACGDSALSFDPLSSQGLFNAIYTGMRAGETAHKYLNGDKSALSVYSNRLEQIRAAYLAHRTTYYAAEQRWLQAPFWRNRLLQDVQGA